MEEVNRLAHQPDTVVVSCEDDLNLDYLVQCIWKKLDLMRVYTKKRGEAPDFDDGLIVRSGASVETVCHAIHRSLAQTFRYALVWVSEQK
jgi:ribosome-interacting GTPase 1